MVWRILPYSIFRSTDRVWVEETKNTMENVIDTDEKVKVMEGVPTPVRRPIDECTYTRFISPSGYRTYVITLAEVRYTVIVRPDGNRANPSDVLDVS